MSNVVQFPIKMQHREFRPLSELRSINPTFDYLTRVLKENILKSLEVAEFLSNHESYTLKDKLIWLNDAHETGGITDAQYLALYEFVNQGGGILAL